MLCGSLGLVPEGNEHTRRSEFRKVCCRASIVECESSPDLSHTVAFVFLASTISTEFFGGVVGRCDSHILDYTFFEEVSAHAAIVVAALLVVISVFASLIR